jgi:dsDNA-specific endonuclease/ATPase MutS2
LEAAELLETLHAKNREADERIRALQLDHQELERQQVELERKAAELREEKRAYRERLSAEKSRDIRVLRSEIEKRIAELPAKDALKEARQDVDEAARKTAQEAREHSQSGKAPGELEVGEEIYVAPLRGRAKVVRFDADRGIVAVNMGGMDFELRVDQLSSALAAPRPDKKASDVEDFDLERLMKGEGEPIEPDAPKPEETASSNPTAALVRPKGKGLFRKRKERQKAEEQKANPKKKKKKGAKKLEFSEDEFLASTPVKTYKREASKKLKAARIEQERGGVHIKRADPDATSVSLTLDLHGQRVDDALRMVDEYLDNAILSDWPHVRLMHGVGTGALSRAIRAHLKDNPVIKAAYAAGPDDGGSGVTIVEFKE